MLDQCGFVPVTVTLNDVLYVDCCELSNEKYENTHTNTKRR